MLHLCANGFYKATWCYVIHHSSFSPPPPFSQMELLPSRSVRADIWTATAEESVSAIYSLLGTENTGMTQGWS